jgi:hypothetical protein
MTSKLTMKQKQAIIAANYGTAQFNRHVHEDAYGDTPSYKILDRWITEVIGVDYRTGVYDNASVIELNRLDNVKRAFCERYSDGWFIGDALKNRLYTLCHHNIQDEQQILAIESELKAMWDFFYSLLPKPKDKFEYVPTGIFFEKEELFRRVEK